MVRIPIPSRALPFLLTVWLVATRPANTADTKPGATQMEVLNPVHVNTVLRSRGADLVPFLKLIRHQYNMKADGDSVGIVVPTLAKDDLLRVLEHAVADSRKWPGADTSGASPVFEYAQFGLADLTKTAIEMAGEDDLDRVAKIVAASAREPFIWTPLFTQIMARLVNREITAIGREVKAPVALPRNVLPDVVAAARPDFRAAWQQYAGVAEMAQSLEQRADGRWTAYSSDKPGFYAVLDRVLAGETEGVLADLALYRWDHGCVDGGELTVPVPWARWLTLLRERRLAEAIGASFTMGPHEDCVVAIRRALIAACRLDSAQIVLGRLLSRSGGEGWSCGGTIWTGGFEPGADLEIFARGTERDALYVFDLARLVAAAQGEPRDDSRNELHSYIGAFAIIAARKMGGPAPLPAPLPARLCEEAEAQFLQYLDGSKSHPVLLTAIEKVGEVRLSAAKGPLRTLLHHWSPSIATAAAASLKALGENVEPPPRPEPVRFRLSLNGRPFSNRSVYALGVYATDAHGMVSIRRDLFTNPREKVTAVQFAPRQNEPGRNGIREVPTLFIVPIPVPANFDVETPVEIATQRLTLTIGANRSARFYQGRRMNIRIARVAAKAEEAKAGDWTLPVGKQFVAELQSGTYAAEVFVPGAAKWKIERFEVGREPVVLPVKLEAATDVEFNIVSPDGKPLENPFEFTRDGARFQPDTAGAHGVLVARGFPAGRYAMRVLSTEEWKKEWYRQPGEIPPREPKYQGREVIFEIPQTLPPELKLGRIVLQPAAP